MNKNIMLFLILCSLTLIITGCSNNSIQSPNCGVDTTHLNNELSIQIMRDLTTFKIGYPIFIEIDKTTDNVLYATDNYDIKLFILSEGDWEQIRDKTLYLFSDLSQTNVITVDSLSFLPEIPLSYEEATIIVCIFGTNADNNEMVAASSRIQLYRSDD